MSAEWSWAVGLVARLGWGLLIGGVLGVKFALASIDSFGADDDDGPKP